MLSRDARLGGLPSKQAARTRAILPRLGEWRSAERDNVSSRRRRCTPASSSYLWRRAGVGVHPRFRQLRDLSKTSGTVTASRTVDQEPARDPPVTGADGATA